MRSAPLWIAVLSFAAPAFAAGYEKGPNGSLVLDLAHIDAGLLNSGPTVTINIFDAAKSIPSVRGLRRERQRTRHRRAGASGEVRCKELDGAKRDDHIDHQNGRRQIGQAKFEN